MKKFFLRLSENRWWVLILGTFGIAALFLLAASLANLDFKPAIHYVAPGEERRLPTDFFWKLKDFSLVEQLVLAGLVVFILCIIILLLTPEGRKRLLKMLLQLTLLILVINWAVKKYRQPETPPEEGGAAAGGMGFETPAEGVVAVYTPPPISPWAIFLTGLVVFLIFLAVGYWLWQRTRPRGSGLPQELARIARSTLDEIRSGGSFEDTVIQCYVRMSAAVNTERGLGRPQAMTPSEFAERLERAGLPAEPVRRLTRLFEKVRYGGVKSSREEANEAIACLTAILQHCGEAV